ncbi:hypothetical protein BaRGS_00022905 [Batillaria attramentaria]|uniref:Uncharacterized protein n=1 Tax=Batillaria attramentaria TaxID=370345 RepID=A0ABD0KFJ3_9CAEN
MRPHNKARAPPIGCTSLKHFPARYPPDRFEGGYAPPARAVPPTQTARLLDWTTSYTHSYTQLNSEPVQLRASATELWSGKKIIFHRHAPDFGVKNQFSFQRQVPDFGVKNQFSFQRHARDFGVKNQFSFQRQAPDFGVKNQFSFQRHAPDFGVKNQFSFQRLAPDFVDENRFSAKGPVLNMRQ